MKYIIVSLKHGSADRPVFWRANDAGYTTSPFAVGIYTEEQVKGDPQYYNNGFSTVAVPLTDQGMHAIGFKCSYDNKQLDAFWKGGLKNV